MAPPPKHASNLAAAVLSRTGCAFFSRHPIPNLPFACECAWSQQTIGGSVFCCPVSEGLAAEAATFRGFIACLSLALHLHTTV
jgi:hypothetical protein